MPENQSLKCFRVKGLITAKSTEPIEQPFLERLIFTARVWAPDAHTASALLEERCGGSERVSISDVVECPEQDKDS
jgi:hypothetical protein